MNVELLVLRFVHVLGGIFWVGSALFLSVFLLPALAKAGPAAGSVLAELQRRRFFIVLPVVAILTVLSGIRLLAVVSDGFSEAYFATTSGRIFGGSGVVAIVAFVIGMLIARPAAARAAQLGATLAAAPEATRPALTHELAALRRRGAVATAIATALILLGAAGMSLARYL